MSNVVDFQQIWAKRRAVEFTKFYVTIGKSAAAKFAKDNIPAERRSLVRPYILEEFEKRGLTLT